MHHLRQGERMNIEQLEAQIKNDRTRFGIQPVELHQVPTWAKRRLLAVIGQRSITNVEGLIPGFQRIFDHWGRSLSDSLVCEPYARNADPGLIEKVRRIADGLGVCYSIGNPWASWWYPGKTLRIEFFETPDSKPLDQLRAEAKAAKRQGKSLFGTRYPN